MTSTWFFLSTLNYDAQSTTHQIYMYSVNYMYVVNYMHTYQLLKYLKSLRFVYRVYVFVSYCLYRMWIKFLCRISPLFVVTYQ